MGRAHFSAVILFFIFVINVSMQSLHAQSLLPPARYDGFPYQKNLVGDADTILIEAFYDPVCPDSRDPWPPLKQALHYSLFTSSLCQTRNGESMQLLQNSKRLIRIMRNKGGLNWVQLLKTLRPEYHDNAFVASRALHIANLLNTSSTFPLLESFFKHQERFYNAETRNKSRASIVEEIVKFAIVAVGNSYYYEIESGFKDRQTDLKTRVSFKYSTSRGVFGTPTFFVNGFALPDTGSTIDYFHWRKIIDPLIEAKTGKGKHPSHLLM